MKKDFFYIITFVLLFSFDSSATNFDITGGSRATAMGNNSVAVADAWSSFNNQAGMANIKQRNANIYCENRFGMKEFSSALCGVTLPTKYGVFATNITYFGLDIYHEGKLGLAFAKGFGENFSIGFQLDILELAIQATGITEHAITFEGGIQYRPSNNITIGLFTFNPAEVSFGNADDLSTISTITRLGISYLPSDNFVIVAEAEQSNSTDMFGKLGFEYKMDEWLKIRVGYYDVPSTFTFGLGTSVKNCSIDLSYQASNARNRTPAISLHCIF